MYRLIHPADRREQPLRMLFHPLGEGVYLRACEADSFRGLVAALLDDPSYEAAAPQSRLVERLRIANDIALLAELEGRRLQISDHEGLETIVIVSDHAFIRSLDQGGFVSLTKG
jgi:hypothetical protein